jgi:hypothetical protein
MTGLSFISGRFAYSAANSMRAGGSVAPKMFGISSSSIASPVRNVRDVYVPSLSISVQSTYPQPKKALQNVQNQMPNSQSHYKANKVPQNQNGVLKAQSFILPDINEKNKAFEQSMAERGYGVVHTPGLPIKWADPWSRSTDVPHDVVDDAVNNTENILHLRLEHDPETGLTTLWNSDGNIIQSDIIPHAHNKAGIWGMFGNPDFKQAFYEQLEKNPGLVWRFDIGEEGESNKAYEGHDILNAIFPHVYDSVTSMKQVTDGYGYTFDVPAWQPGADFNGWGSHCQVGQRYDTITSIDLSGLDGLTLEERDKFYTEVQKIFDKNGVQADARKESYRFHAAAPKDMPKPTVGCNGQPLPKDYDWTPFPGGWSWGGTDSPIDQAAVQKVQDEIFANSTLHALFEKAAGVRNGTIADDTLAQQYSILVTDSEGNRLANDRIIVAARNGNQVEMSVDQFSKMSRLDITKLLR